MAPADSLGGDRRDVGRELIARDQQRLEPLHHPVAGLQGPSADRVHLDRAEPGVLGLFDAEGEHRLIGGPHRLLPGSGPAEGRQDRGEHLRGAAVEGGEEGVFLALEMPVEDALGGPGALHDLGDRGGLVALLGDERRQRAQDALGRMRDRLALLERARPAAPAARRLSGPGGGG